MFFVLVRQAVHDACVLKHQAKSDDTVAALKLMDLRHTAEKLNSAHL